MSIVITSSRKQPRRGAIYPIAIAATVGLVAILYFVLRERPEPTRPHPEVPGPKSADPSKLISHVLSMETPNISSPQSTISQDSQGTSTISTPSTAPQETLPESQDIAPANFPSVQTAQLVTTSFIGEKRIFDNRVENLLETVSSPDAKFGLMPMSINMTDEQVMEYLKRPVNIYEDDDEATIAAKERTAGMKTAALKYIEEGGTFDQFIRENVIVANEIQGVIDDVRKEMKRRLHDEGVEAAQAYLAEVNPQLKEQGFEEIKLRKGEIILMERQKAREAAESAKKE